MDLRLDHTLDANVTIFTPYGGGLFNGASKGRGAILDAVKASQL